MNIVWASMVVGFLALATAVVVGGEVANAELRFVEAATKAAVSGTPALGRVVAPLMPDSGTDHKASVP